MNQPPPGLADVRSQRETDKAQAPAATPATISLPKGGGAIRGMGEKFAANPVTGTGSMSVPIATSPGRAGFGPQLSLSYDSGAGNGPFGFGWSLSLPAITRKTEKGLPQYHDAEESDVFILSGAEDLVPVFKKNPDGSWLLGPTGNRSVRANSPSMRGRYTRTMKRSAVRSNSAASAKYHRCQRVQNVSHNRDRDNELWNLLRLQTLL
jgi:hypothetical protein